MGRQLKVETHGTGLGQMQIQVEYNIPVEANAECKYNVTIQRHIASFTPVVTSEYAFTVIISLIFLSMNSSLMCVKSCRPLFCFFEDIHV